MPASNTSAPSSGSILPDNSAVGDAKFVTLEGGEGVGKSTQAARLVARLRASGQDAVATREPGGTPKAEAIRGLLLSGGAAPLGPAAEAVLFFAARADHLSALIRPAMARGVWVICDRFSDSTRAYQGAAGHVDPALLAGLERVVVDPTRPDLTLMLDLPQRVGLARARMRSGGDADRFESQDDAFHDRLRRAFLAIAAAEPERCAVIDASIDVDAVAQAIWHAVEARLLPSSRATAAA